MSGPIPAAPRSTCWTSATPTSTGPGSPQGMGVEAARAETCERFADLFAQANTRKGPFLIELAI